MGAWFINVQKVDLAMGSYDMDFYVWFRWSGNIAIDHEFMNGIPSAVQEVRNEPGYHEMRVRGNFIKGTSFKDFPFDKHRLTVELEDRSSPIDKLQYSSMAAGGVSGLGSPE